MVGTAGGAVRDEGEAALVPPGSPLWAEALEVVPHDVYHLPGYVRLCAGGESEPVAFCYREGGTALLVPLLLRRVEGTDRVDAASPYGYPGPVSNAPLDDTGFWDRAVRALLDALAARGAVTCFLRLHPLVPPRLDVLATHGHLVNHGRTVVIDTTLPEERFWSGMHKRLRNTVRGVQRRGLTTVFDDWSFYADFQDAYRETMLRVGALPGYLWGPDHFDGLREALGDALHLSVVLHEGRCVSGTLFMAHQGLVAVHLGGTRTDAMHLEPGKLETVDLRVWAADRGFRAIHVGGGLGGAEDELFRFKAGFSPDRAAFFTWRAVVDPRENRRLVAQLPDVPAAGFFPAYRSPAP